MDRRKLVMVTQACMALAAGIFAVLVLATDLDSDPISGPLRWWHPFIYMMVAGIAHSIIQPVRQSMVANTVPRQALTSAFALNGMVHPTARILGPALGGVLIATLGFKWNFFLEAMAYLAIVLLLLPARLPYRTESPSQRVSAFTSLMDGVRYVWHDRRIVQLIVLAFIPNFVFQPIGFMLPVFTTEVLGRGVETGGMLAAAIGVGGIFAAIIIAAVGFVVRKGLVTFFGLIGGCVFVLLFSQSSWLFASLALLAGMGFCQYVFRVSNGILVQTIVPDNMRGRVTSIYQLEHGLTPLATLLISLLVHFWNPSDAFTLIGGIAFCVAVVLALTFRQSRRLE
jgi:MFS family permease